MMTDAIDQLIRERDEKGLYTLLVEWGTTDDHGSTKAQIKRLLDAYQYMSLQPSQWIEDRLLRLEDDDDVLPVEHSIINDAWFVVFRRLMPLEILASLEYTHFTQRQNKWLADVRADVHNNAYLVIDIALGVNFANNVTGSVVGVRAREYFLKMPTTSASMEDIWFGGASRGESSTGLLPLKPPRDRPFEWLWFHIKMRRIAFLLIHAVAKAWGGQAIHALYQYASALRVKTWALDNIDENDGDSYDTLQLQLSRYSDDAAFLKIVNFFMPAAETSPLVQGEFYTSEEWANLVRDTVFAVCLEEGRLSDRVLDDDDLSHASTYKQPYIYDGTAKMQGVFYRLVSHIQ
jgi:hypothetical protein